MKTAEVVKLVVFIVASAGLAWITRASLRAPGSHGFFRFFAWLCILGLVLLNLESWIRDPLSARQIVSWVLLAASLLLLVPGLLLLRRIGKPADIRKNEPLVGIERTTELVSVGLYRYIRHPLYSSLLFLAWGAFAKEITIASACLAVAASIFLFVTAKREEKENIGFFGDSYTAYLKRTRMFIPFLF